MLRAADLTPELVDAATEALLMSHRKFSETRLEAMRFTPFSYRAVWWPSGGSTVQDHGDHVALTVYGMVHSQHPTMLQLAEVFVAALQIAATRYLEFEPSPTAVAPLVLDGRTLTEKANARTGASLTAAQLHQMLSHEPATWSGLRVDGDSFVWDLAHSQVSRFRDVASPRAYLSTLSDFLGTALVATPTPGLHATALPDAFDRLDLVWQLVFGHRLLRILRAAVPIELTLPVADRADFSSRTAALADLLATMTVRQKPQSRGDPLEMLKSVVRDKLPDDGEAAEAADTLLHVRGVRHALLHPAARAAYEGDWQALGLDGFGEDWGARWEHLRYQTMRALETLSNRLLSQRDTQSAGASPSPR